MKDEIRLVTLKDSSQWVLVSLGCDVSLSSKGEAFGVTASSACVVRIGIAPSSKEDWSMLRKKPRRRIVSAARRLLDLNGPDPGTYHLRWDKRGDGDLYMLAAPHHVSTLVDSSVDEGRSYLTGAKGTMHWFKGDSWKLREALPDVSLASASFRDGRVDRDTLTTIKQRCERDIAEAS